ncbi:hypothetical protein KAR91_53045 [Candidatus Pacearchaeota archaeon]|nr:hypothetical protein [Candidatus Pacearchaeota archaeon]
MQIAITHKGILTAMAKRQLIRYPIDKGYSYVDEVNNVTKFEYKGKQYDLNYIDGCFYPFVFKTQ